MKNNFYFVLIFVSGSIFLRCVYPCSVKYDEEYKYVTKDFDTFSKYLFSNTDFKQRHETGGWPRYTYIWEYDFRSIKIYANDTFYLNPTNIELELTECTPYMTLSLYIGNEPHPHSQLVGDLIGYMEIGHERIEPFGRDNCISVSNTVSIILKRLNKSKEFILPVSNEFNAHYRGTGYCHLLNSYSGIRKIEIEYY